MKIEQLPKEIAVFPLSNFIIFPSVTVPLNIFEPRYIEMVNDSMASNKLVGIIQPKNFNNSQTQPILHDIGCLGKITSFKDLGNERYLIELKGLIRFKIIKEVDNSKKYREYEVNFRDFNHDLDEKKENLNDSDLEFVFKNLKSLFEAKGYIINWKELEKQSLSEIVDALVMAYPFSLEEKQVLLEAKTLVKRKNKISEILNTYTHDIFNNTTLQ